MKILHFVVVPSDERFTVLADAISASHGSLGVAAVYSNGFKVLLRCNITIAEFNRVAREHADLLKQTGRRPAWYEMDICVE
jgi:hypothetical protein